MTGWRLVLQRLQALPQLLQFIVVGGSAAATHLATVGVVVSLPGMPPLWANVLGFLVAFIVSYNGHAWLTFSAAQARGWATVARFFAVACLGLWPMNRYTPSPCMVCTGTISGAWQASWCWWQQGLSF